MSNFLVRVILIFLDQYWVIVWFLLNLIAALVVLLNNGNRLGDVTVIVEILRLLLWETLSCLEILLVLSILPLELFLSVCELLGLRLLLVLLVLLELTLLTGVHYSSWLHLRLILHLLTHISTCHSWSIARSLPTEILRSIPWTKQRLLLYWTCCIVHHWLVFARHEAIGTKQTIWSHHHGLLASTTHVAVLLCTGHHAALVDCHRLYRCVSSVHSSILFHS